MRRRAGLGLLVVALLVVVLGAPADAAPVSSPHSYLDRRGDARYGRADVLGVTVDNGPRITVTVRMVDAIAFRRWGTRIRFLAVEFTPKTAMEIDRASATFGTPGVAICPVTRRLLADRESYEFSMRRACMRNPERIRVSVLVVSDRVDRRDHAPNRGWSPWVKRRR